jgi:hypothetical protein
MTRPGPDAASGSVPDRHLTGLLRWYPRAWRERYGAEFLALMEDTLGGRGPGWRLRLGVARAGLRERGHQARLTGRRILPRLARGAIRNPGSVAIAAGYLAAIVARVLDTSPGRQADVILGALIALTGLAGLALLAGGLAALPALARGLRAGRRPRLRRGLAGAAAAIVATAAALAWLVLWSGTSSLTPLSTSPTCMAGLIGTVVALAAALRQCADVARRLELTPLARAAESRLGTVAVPVIVVLTCVSVVWYSVLSIPAFWLVWGAVWYARRGSRLTREIRRGRMR